jgi:hypothetical protein
MAQKTFYIDIEGNALLAGLNSTTNVDPASLLLSYPDTVPVRIYLMDRLQTADPQVYPYEVLNTTGMSLLLEMTDGEVGAGRTIYANQVVWQTDPTNSYFYANLSLATANILALLMANEPGEASVWLKLAYVQNGYQTDVYNNEVPISIGVGTAIATAPATLTPATVEVSNQTYYPQAPVAGLPLFVTSPLGKIILIAAVDNPDGTASRQDIPQN